MARKAEAQTELTVMRAMIPWDDLGGEVGHLKHFWDTVYVGRITGMSRRLEKWGSRRGAFRLSGLAVGAVVPALAGFGGVPVRIAAAAAAVVAVVLNGVATTFHVDQRVVVNRQYMEELLAAGWTFVCGRGRYGTPPTSDSFGIFIDEVQKLLDQHAKAYLGKVYQASPEPQE